MKIIFLFLLCSFSVFVSAQDAAFNGHKWEAPYQLATPKDWGVERFLLPPSFAPEITYKGVEDIRFTPGWSNSKSDEYWSYTFLWFLDEMPSTDAGVIETNLKNYYTGLIKVNGVPKEQTIPVVTKFKKVSTDDGDLQTYTGTVQMTDYMSRAPITLNSKVHFKSCSDTGKAIVFFEMSTKPSTHPVWKSLHQLWNGFKCNK